MPGSQGIGLGRLRKTPFHRMYDPPLIYLPSSRVTSGLATIFSELEPATHDEWLSPCSQQLNERVACPESRYGQMSGTFQTSFPKCRGSELDKGEPSPIGVRIELLGASEDHRGSVGASPGPPAGRNGGAGQGHMDLGSLEVSRA